MSRKPSRTNLSVLAQLCNLIPAFLVSKIARQCGLDKKARTFSPWPHLAALLFAQFTHALSLNDVRGALKNHAGNLGHADQGQHAGSRQERRPKKPAGKISRDDLIVLTMDSSREKYPRALRRVLALVEADGKEREMEFLANNLEWAASSIADLYKSRRQIEVFFKEIKQTPQWCDFLGHNKNAIPWQVWTALMFYVLLRFLAFANSWRHGFKRLFCLLRSSVWDGVGIGSLASRCGTAGGAPAMRAAPELLYLHGFGPQRARA